MSTVVLVCSEKRDMGKTILSIKTGIGLSNKGKNVLLLDLSSGNKKISEYLNVDEDIIYDIKDVLDGICSIDQSVIKVKENLSVLPYPRIPSKLGDIKRESFIKLILDLKMGYDIIIVDMDSIAVSYYVDFNEIEGVVIVNNNDFSAVKEINSACGISDKFGIKKIIVVLNKYNKKGASKGLMLKCKEIKKIISKDIAGIIEENTKYETAGYDFLFDIEKNMFNNTIDNIISVII